MKYIGIKEEDKVYEKREAVYGLIFNENKELAIIDIERFGFNLPGGKKENKENSIATLTREVEEEIGYTLKNIEFFDKIGAYYNVKVNDQIIYCEAKAEFYTALIGEKNDKEIEDDHELVWFRPEAIYERMVFDFQRYMIEKLIRQ